MFPAENLVGRWVAWMIVMMTWLSVAGNQEGCYGHSRRTYPYLPLQRQDPICQWWWTLNMSSLFLWFVSFCSTLEFLALKSRRMVFENSKVFWRRWDAVNIRVRCQNRHYLTLGTLNYWIFQLHGRQLVPSHVPLHSMVSKSVLRKSPDEWGWSPLQYFKGFLFSVLDICAFRRRNCPKKAVHSIPSW